MGLEQSTVHDNIFKVACSLLDGCGCEGSSPLHYREFIRGRDDIAFSGQSFRLQAIGAALAHAAPEAIARSTADDLLLRFLNKQYSSEYLKLWRGFNLPSCLCVIQPSTWPLLVGSSSEESGSFERRGGAKSRPRFLLACAQQRHQSCEYNASFR